MIPSVPSEIKKHKHQPKKLTNKVTKDADDDEQIHKKMRECVKRLPHGRSQTKAIGEKVSPVVLLVCELSGIDAPWPRTQEEEHNEKQSSHLVLHCSLSCGTVFGWLKFQYTIKF